jgi:hypothetical protein
MTQEVRPMYGHYHLPTAGWPAGAAARRRWARRLLLAVAASLLGLLPGIQGLAPASPAVVQAAQQDHPTAAMPASGTAGAAPPPDSGPTRDALDDAVQSTGASDEQLDVSAELDRGARLFFLQARAHDWGQGQADYYLAGPQGVSHQPLRDLFAPLAAWLAAPGHEHELVLLGLQSDPRSADPARFDAACQALQDSLGKYLLKASDLPDGKALGELAPDELAALQAQPRVITDWSACTGEQPPLARPEARPAPADTSYEHWMADNAQALGQRPLRQVVIPGSHDAATYGGEWANIFYDEYAPAQDQDMTTQLNAGSRSFDLRFECFSWSELGCSGADDLGEDYYNFHGPAISKNVTLSTVLDAIRAWVDQPGHEREIVVLNFGFGSDEGSNANRLATICQTYILPEINAGRVLQPSMVPPGTSLADMSLNEIWALPGQPHVIITGWDDCTGQSWPALFGGSYYADNCVSAQAIIDKLAPQLADQPGTGLYSLQISGTPELNQCGAIPPTPSDMAAWQGPVLAAIQGWWQQDQYHARANLNYLPGDFVGDSDVPIAQTAVGLNQSAQAPQLSLASDPNAYPPVTMTCDDPRGTPPTLVVYPAAEGAQSANRKTYTGAAGTASVRAFLSAADFPTAWSAAPADYLRAECAHGAPPSETSRLGVIPLSAFGQLPQVGAAPQGSLQVAVACVNPRKDGIHLAAYPNVGGPQPTSPYAQTWDAPAGQLVLQATYTRRGDYDVEADCENGPQSQLINTIIPDQNFPRLLSIRQGGQLNQFLYCDRDPQLTGSATLSLAAQIPNAPAPLSVTGTGSGARGTLSLTVPAGYFPNGDYQLQATCASSDTLPFTAAPLTLSSSQIPTGGPTATPTATPTAPATPTPTATPTGPVGTVSAKITDCSAQGADAYACALQVTLGGSLAVNTVFSVGISSGFANPSGGDRPQVTASQGCQGPPLPSPYLAAGNGSYTRYDVNIGPGGCAAGAVVTFAEAVTGAPGSTITQPVTVPGFNAATATFVLPEAPPTSTPTRPAATPTPSPTVAATPTATPRPTGAATPARAAPGG